MSTVLKVENLSKQYRLGTVGSGTLRDDMARFWARLRGKEDPTLKIGEVNDRTTKGNSDYVWALKDINFEVKQGEILGIIGKNGAGKSTLLKILSKVTAPTTGRVRAKGRIASLLEVGTGFHPELTGRENIYLNGAILGMTKAEIRAKLDEIVDFAGVEKYLDTPVKRYSSGMTVRLGFAVAAHLEPEILIVDEVLAVGDAEFQKKAIGKMQDVSKGEGRTVLFVSHNMGSVKRLCNRGVLLINGGISFLGGIEEVINQYIDDNLDEFKNGVRVWDEVTAPGGKELKLLQIRCTDIHKKTISTVRSDVFFNIELTFKCFFEIEGSRMIIQLLNREGTVVFTSTNHNESGKIDRGILVIKCEIPANLLNEQEYLILVHSGIPGQRVLIQGEPFLSINVKNMGTHGSDFPEKWPGLVAPKLNWIYEKVGESHN